LRAKSSEHSDTELAGTERDNHRASPGQVQFSRIWEKHSNNDAEGFEIKAAIYDSAAIESSVLLRIQDVPRPEVKPGYVLLCVLACGVCRTDLHIVERDLPPIHTRIIPGHQIVGKVVGGATDELPIGVRAGVSWMGGIDGDCWYCRHGMENLCDKPVFTGYIRQHLEDMPEIRNWHWTADFSESSEPAPLAKGHPRASVFTDA
jgi:Alcohol dehydrogenase GroES-like domain